ncbi:hypothetical protein GCM10011413_33500 [Pedobacter psychrotolerans]|uniref:Uncharacterized protein n=1 Tax=Pedobacter psychrotolerans TaxID=1843235 RepID=A0ABQ1STQ1_9SPHI|nr:hypothetical protein GCM10011413_33500 [Pedobacter psychrotolerans]
MALMVFSGISPLPPRCASALKAGNEAVFCPLEFSAKKDAAVSKIADLINFIFNELSYDFLK